MIALNRLKLGLLKWVCFIILTQIVCNRKDTKRYHLLVYLENKYPPVACQPYFIIYLTLIFISVFTFLVYCALSCHAFNAD